MSINLTKYILEKGFDQDTTSDGTFMKWTSDLYQLEIRYYGDYVKVYRNDIFVNEFDLIYGKYEPIIKYCDGIIKNTDRSQTIKKILNNEKPNRI